LIAVVDDVDGYYYCVSCLTHQPRSMLPTTVASYASISYLLYTSQSATVVVIVS